MICVDYVNGIIFWSKDTADINSSAMQLRELGVNLEQEDNAAGFLGVTLKQDPETGLLEMKQTRLIKQVIKALGTMDLSKESTLHLNPNHRSMISTVKQQVGLSATAV